MSTAAPVSSPSPVALASPPRLSVAGLPLLMLLFVGSGCAALIYEIVWFQLLQFVIGSSAYSIGVLLGTFMGGMCLGSLLFSRLVPRGIHPLRVYAFLEIAIGVTAVLLTFLMPVFDRVYIAMAIPGGSTALLLRAMVCAVCLLPPTMLMGATLPAISRWVETTPRGVSWLGFFYGGNTAGAVIGCLVAGFYLLPHLDMQTATFIAVGINILVGLIGLGLASALPFTPAVAEKGESAQALTEAPDADLLGAISIYVAIGLSGMAALGAEVVWTRLLSLLLGSTVYTFSIILAVFLVGLGIGSSVGAMLTRAWSARDGGMNARLALVWSQVFCALGIGWSAWAVTNGVTNWPVSPFIAISPSYQFHLDLARCAYSILPATLFWGASFPFALAAASRADTGSRSGRRDPAKTVGRVYAANTVGAIAGALLFSLHFIPAYQTPACEHILIGLAMAAALVALLPAFRVRRAGTPAEGVPSSIGLFFALLLAVALPASVLGLLVNSPQLDEPPDKLVTWGRQMHQMGLNDPNDVNMNVLFRREGINSTVAVSEVANGYRKFHVSGKCEASTLPEDMRLQLMLGHFPAFFHPAPRKVLIVGCGAGITAGCFINHPEVEKIVICEIEPLIPEVVATYFSRENNDVVSRKADDGKFVDKRVEVVYDDARHYILTTKEKFDIITSDPIHPWVKGAATLYTKEYFELVKQHLNPGGLVTQWVPLYESSEAVVNSEVATFFGVFPGGAVWNNAYNGGGYDTIVMGGDAPLRINAETLAKRMDGNFIASKLLADVGINGPVEVLKTFAASADDLADWMRTAEINYDRNLRLQYLAGASLNSTNASTILHAIDGRRTYPAGMLTAPPGLEAALRKEWNLPAK